MNINFVRFGSKRYARGAAEERQQLKQTLQRLHDERPSSEQVPLKLTEITNRTGQETLLAIYTGDDASEFDVYEKASAQLTPEARTGLKAMSVPYRLEFDPFVLDFHDHGTDCKDIMELIQAGRFQF
jgi:hypothetical protein